MSASIWKFPLDVVDEQAINAPRGATILCVQTQNDVPCAWVHVPDTGAPPAPINLLTYGTGHPCHSTPDQYVGSYQLHGGALVFHVFKE